MYHVTSSMEHRCGMVQVTDRALNVGYLIHATCYFYVPCSVKHVTRGAVHCDSGKLTPTFVPARVVALTVKLAYAYTLSLRFPSVVSQPLNASDTL